jgi:hypothetical protein
VGFIGNPVAEFLITIAISLLGIVVSVLIYRRSQEKKLIYWDVIFTDSLSSFQIPHSDKLEMLVLFDGDPLLDVSIVELKIWNGGNKTILKADYDGQFRFTFQQDAKILSVDLKEATKNIAEKPEDIYEFTSEHVLIKPLNLNPEETIVLKVLITPRFNGEIKQNGKIIGGRIIPLTNTQLTGMGYIKAFGEAYSLFLFPFKELLEVLPVPLVLGAIFFITWAIWGGNGLAYLFFGFMFFLMPLSLWYAMLSHIILKLEKRKIAFKLWKLALIVGIPPLLFILFIAALLLYPVYRSTLLGIFHP